ncbi:MAG: hypothetical protein FD137_739 [Spirochaetes bacterium]|nr:MAG: hypothetical protein FD137_739 [Spirochaetota bacterium]
MMTRREFLKGCAAVGASALMLSLPSRVDRLYAQGKSPAPIQPAADPSARKSPDLVAVRGGSQSSRLDRAMQEFGGIGTFVRKGQTVVIKPNIGWSQEPQVAANTNPELVKRLVEHCLEAGAAKVWVFDHSCDNGPRSYRDSKIESYAKSAGAVVVPGDNSSHYQMVSIPGAVALKRAKFHELALEADVFINVPVLKDHSGAGMTCAMKNLMGAVWDRGEFHRLGLDQCIADVGLWRKPILNIVDAGKVMLSGGPRGYASSRYAEPQLLIASRDIVAVDTVSAMTLGRTPGEFGYIAMAERANLGTTKIAELDIRRLSI